MVWAPDYITVADAKAYLRVVDTADDAEIQGWVSTASRDIDDHCNRQFGQVDAAEERRYTAWWDVYRRRWVVDIDDLDDDTGLAVQVDGTAVTAYTLEPVNAVLTGKVWTRLVFSPDAEVQPSGAEHEVAVTALWGWTTVPAAVTHAVRLQMSRFAARRDSPYGIAGSPDQGSELRLLSRLDPDVVVSLRGYVRTRRPR